MNPGTRAPQWGLRPGKQGPWLWGIVAYAQKRRLEVAPERELGQAAPPVGPLPSALAVCRLHGNDGCFPSEVREPALWSSL